MGKSVGVHAGEIAEGNRDLAVAPVDPAVTDRLPQDELDGPRRVRGRYLAAVAIVATGTDARPGTYAVRLARSEPVARMRVERLLCSWLSS